MSSHSSVRRLMAAGMLFVLMGSHLTLPAQYAAPGPPPSGYAGQGGWDAPPSEYSEIQRKGFHDGLEGARKDYENHRQANVENRDEYRHPNVDRRFREDYRTAFARGYDVGVRHMTGR